MTSNLKVYSRVNSMEKHRISNGTEEMSKIEVRNYVIY